MSLLVFVDCWLWVWPPPSQEGQVSLLDQRDLNVSTWPIKGIIFKGITPLKLILWSEFHYFLLWNTDGEKFSDRIHTWSYSIESHKNTPHQVWRNWQQMAPNASCKIMGLNMQKGISLTIIWFIARHYRWIGHKC